MQSDELFKFEKTEKGCVLKRYLQKDNADITELEIPAKFGELTVDSIGSIAFKDAVYLKSIAIPDTVTIMEHGAFEGCRTLSDISLPNGLRLISSGIFRGCSSLRRVVFPEGAEVFFPYAFSDCSALEEVVLPANGRTIYSGVFRDCPKLRSVVFPIKGKIMLRGQVFVNCPLLPPETRMFTLIGTNDLDKPFIFNTYFDWSTALREDVFALAIEHNSFANIGKPALFKQIISSGLIGLLPIAAKILDAELAETLSDYAAEQGKTEITAWLLNFINGGGSDSIEQIINERFDF